MKKDLKALISTLQSDETLTKALQKTGRVVERAVKKEAPVVNGILRMSIGHEVEGNTVHIGTNIPYAPYVEYGTGIHAVNGDGRKTGWSYIVEGAYADKYWAEGKKNCFIDENGNKRMWTRGQAPNPFMERAWIQTKQEVLEILGGELLDV